MSLPLLTSHLPGTGGRFKSEDEDFVVEELPAYPAMGAGDHSYLRIEKRGITTHEAVRRVARALGVAPKAIGFAGLKDAHAVTIQTISVEHVPIARCETALAGIDGVRLLGAKLHRNKIKLGHLRGNRFFIRLRDVVPGAAARALDVLAELSRVGCPNYFGEQRFGNRADNDRVGRLLVLRDFDGACEAAGEDLRRKPHNLLRLLVSAYQSALFNRLVAARMPHLGRLETGDLAFLHGRGAVFLVEDAAHEQPRADHLEVSPSAPMFGMRTLLASGAPGERERAVLAEEGVTPEMFDVPGVGRFDGERRPVRIPVLAPEVLEVDGDPTSIVVRFDLPRGSYATVVLAEVMKSP
jgi:tRNA pseudouridine13 synthase